MKNLSLDTCQWLAGETIKRAKDKIIYKSSEKNNFISIDKYDRATVSYNQGRDFRTTDMREANNRFIEAVELANEAVHSVELVSRSQRRTTLIAIVAIIISLSTFLAKFFGWFPTP